MTFSVLISVYHRESPVYLKEALDSIVKQTLLPSEIVIVKDGPLSDELEAVIDNFDDSHPGILKLIPLAENMGLGHALNIGLQHCAHETVVRMDSDDVCYAERFEKQINHLKAHPHLSVVGAAIQEFRYKPGDIQQFRKLPSGSQELATFAKYRSPLNHPSVAFRKSHILEVGSYQDMPYFEDYYLWVSLISKGYLIDNLDEPLLHFRTGNDMIGRRQGLAYFRHELNFLTKLRKIGFLSAKQFSISIASRLPLRLLPKKLLSLLYKTLLR